MFEQIGIPIEGLGDGFSWKSQDLEHSAQLARDGWQRRKAPPSLAGEHFLVVLDEITYPLIYGWLPLPGVLDTLKNRPGTCMCASTGRRCPPEIIELADTVTEMTKVKRVQCRRCPRSAASRTDASHEATAAIAALLSAWPSDRWWGEPRAVAPSVRMGHYLVWAGRRVAPALRDGADGAFLGRRLAWSLGVLAVLVGAHLAVGLVTALMLLLPTQVEWLWGVAARRAAGPVAQAHAGLAHAARRGRGGESALAESLDAGRAQLAQLVSRDVATDRGPGARKRD